MLCSFALFVSSFGFIGPEQPHWGSGQLRYICEILGAQHLTKGLINHMKKEVFSVTQRQQLVACGTWAPC